MILYHYCSSSSFFSMISNREIWLSDLSLTNDAMEGKWIREVFKAACIEKGVVSSDQNRLLAHLESLISVFGGAGFCMSEYGDLLSQWRAYADNGNGFSLGFNYDYFEILSSTLFNRNDKFGVKLIQVEYNSEKQREKIQEPMEEIIELVKKGAFRFPTLLTGDDEIKQIKALQGKLFGRILVLFPYIYELKNPGFLEESEWRLVAYLPAGDRTEFIKEMEFRVSGSCIVPFYRLPLEKLDRKIVEKVVIEQKPELRISSALCS